jgi:hypothetical protein
MPWVQSRELIWMWNQVVDIVTTLLWSAVNSSTSSLCTSVWRHVSGHSDGCYQEFASQQKTNSACTRMRDSAAQFNLCCGLEEAASILHTAIFRMHSAVSGTCSCGQCRSQCVMCCMTEPCVLVWITLRGCELRYMTLFSLCRRVCCTVQGTPSHCRQVRTVVLPCAVPCFMIRECFCIYVIFCMFNDAQSTSDYTLTSYIVGSLFYLTIVGPFVILT